MIRGRASLRALGVPLATGVLFAAVACAPSQAPVAAPPAAPASIAPRPAVTFIEDDYARALAEAKRTKRPLFIDAWAPWCHTCLSMRAYVFGDPALAPLADKLVWLAVDTEKPENAPFLAKYPMRFWPTLWVVDAEREAPLLKWAGAATAPELALLLEDAAFAPREGAAGSEAAAAFVRAKQATAGGNHAEAVSEYRKALADAPPAWKRRPQVAEALVSALHEAKDDAACVAHARAEIPRLPPGTSLANVALVGLTCARSTDRDADPAAVAELAAVVKRVAEDPAQPILADDRSGLFEELVSLYEDRKDPQAARSAARAWATFLEAEAKKAPTNEARAVFDAHRLGAYVALGEPARALPMLAASERDFPADYNPPARLALAYLELHRHDDALAAVERALTRVYGGRELRVRNLKADIQIARGDTEGARATLRDALARAEKLPLAPNYAKLRDTLAKRLATLETPKDR